MPEFHAEPYIHLAGLSSTSALIAWGAFYFRVRSKGAWKLVDDRDLEHVHPPRCDSIGVRSAPYGTARVNVFDSSGALVQSYGGRAQAIHFVEGYSTSELVRRIRGGAQS